MLQFSFFWKLMCFYRWIERLFVGFYLVGWETRGMNVSCKVMRWTMIEYFGTLLLVSWSNDCVTIWNQNSFERYNTQILTFSILQYLVQFCFLFFIFCFFSTAYDFFSLDCLRLCMSPSSISHMTACLVNHIMEEKDVFECFVTLSICCL